MGGAIFQNGGNLAFSDVVFRGNEAIGGSEGGNGGYGGGGVGGPGGAKSGASGGDLGGVGGVGTFGFGETGDAGAGGGEGWRPGWLCGNGGFGGGGGAGNPAGSPSGVAGFGGGNGDAGGGGAIFEYAGSLTLANVVFVSNTSLAGSADQACQAKGGALFVYSGATATAANTAFSLNVAADAGKAGIGSSAAPYTNGSTCPGMDTDEVCGMLTILPSQTITFPQPPDTAINAGPVSLTASASSGLAVTYTSNSTAVCTVAGSSATLVSIGTCSTTAHQAGDSTHAAAPDVTDMFNVTQVGQSIVFGALSNHPPNSQFTVSAIATSGLPVSFAATSASAGVCSVSGTTVTTMAVGTCGIVASQDGNATYAAAMSVTQSFQVVGSPFITAQSPGPLRNNYTGFVGFEFTVGSTPVTVASLGRFVVAGNTQTHVVKLVAANGADVPGGSAAVNTAGAAVGTYQYAALSGGVTLLANTSYSLVSQETAGGDQWYDFGPVTTSGVGTVADPVYTDQMGNYVAVTVLAGRSYVPVNFLYAPPTTALDVNIASPGAGATVAGTTSIGVSTTGPVTQLQVQVDGVNQGSPVAVSVNQGPSYTLSLDTTVLTNGTHAITVVAKDAASDAITSSGVSVTVSNSPGGSTPFVLSQTPGGLRNNSSQFVGVAIAVGSTPVVVTSLGRFVAPGNSGTHLLKLVNANGTDVTGGSVSISLNGATAGQFRYATLPAGPLTLQPNTTYYLVSQETAGVTSGTTMVRFPPAAWPLSWDRFIRTARDGM